MTEIKWSHIGLIEDLAGHLKTPNTMVWTDMQLGPSGSPRPDVYRMNMSFAHPNPLAYECKVSRSDYLSDVTYGKWSSYLKYAYGVIFAVPEGMVSAKEIPDRCGLIYRHASTWRAAKRPIIEPHPIPEEAWIKLLIDGVHREGPINRRKHWDNWAVTEAFTKKFGAEAARWIHDACSVQAKVANAEEVCKEMYEKSQEQAERIRSEAIREMPEIWSELIEILGLPQDANKYQIQVAVADVRRTKNNSQQKSALKVLDNITYQIGHLRNFLEPKLAENIDDANA